MPGGVAAIVVGLQPLLTAVLAGSWLREYVGPRQWLGLLVGLVGISLVLLPKLEFGNEGITPITIGVCLISVVGMTLGTVFQKKYGGMSDLRTGTAMQYVGALVPTFIFAAMFESFAIDWNGQALFALFWLVFVLSIAAVFLLMWLIREGSVSQVSSLFYLVPAVATLMTWYLFDEQLNLIQISGMVLCALAVALGAAKPKVAGKEA